MHDIVFGMMNAGSLTWRGLSRVGFDLCIADFGRSGGWPSFIWDWQYLAGLKTSKAIILVIHVYGGDSREHGLV